MKFYIIILSPISKTIESIYKYAVHMFFLILTKMDMSGNNN